MWKDLEAQRQEAELDPAMEAGSDIFELEGRYLGVQRLHALGAQVRAKTGQKAGQKEPEKPNERGQGGAMDVEAGGPAPEGSHSVAEAVLSTYLFLAFQHGRLAALHMRLLTLKDPGHAFERSRMHAARP